jgi:uncharacterized membrane protein
MHASHKDMCFAAFAFITPTQKLTLKPEEGEELISRSRSSSSSSSRSRSRMQNNLNYIPVILFLLEHILSTASIKYHHTTLVMQT